MDRNDFWQPQRGAEQPQGMAVHGREDREGGEFNDERRPFATTGVYSMGSRTLHPPLQNGPQTFGRYDTSLVLAPLQTTGATGAYNTESKASKSKASKGKASKKAAKKRPPIPPHLLNVELPPEDLRACQLAVPAKDVREMVKIMFAMFGTKNIIADLPEDTFGNNSTVLKMIRHWEEKEYVEPLANCLRDLGYGEYFVRWSFPKARNRTNKQKGPTENQQPGSETDPQSADQEETPEG